MKSKYILTSLLNDTARNCEYYLCFASNAAGVYVLTKTKDQGCSFTKDAPWTQLHMPYRYATKAETQEQLFVQLRKSAKMIDPKVKFKEGVSEEIFVQTPWWPPIEERK